MELKQRIQGNTRMYSYPCVCPLDQPACPHMRSPRQAGTAIAAGQCLESGRLAVTESVVSVYQLDQNSDASQRYSCWCPCWSEVRIPPTVNQRFCRTCGSCVNRWTAVGSKSSAELGQLIARTDNRITENL